MLREGRRVAVRRATASSPDRVVHRDQFSSPSGNVASTCTSWIISGTPSITSASFENRRAEVHEFSDGLAVPRPWSMIS
jgi:hypothetical protein